MSRRTPPHFGAISWFSRVQKVTAVASSGSEHVALSEMGKKLRFLRKVEEFMVPPIDKCMRIHEDNDGAIKMASSRRTRNVGVKHHIMCDAIDGELVYVKRVRSEEQHVDILTKALYVKDIRKAREIPSGLFVMDNEG